MGVQPKVLVMDQTIQGDLGFKPTCSSVQPLADGTGNVSVRPSAVILLAIFMLRRFFSLLPKFVFGKE